jgi:hypothetical protein
MKNKIPRAFQGSEVEISDIFKGQKIYYSGSIRGSVSDALIGFEIVKYLLQNGAEVPSAHVAARNNEEILSTFYEMSGEGLDENGDDNRTPEMVYRVDMGWVDEATHVIAVVDGTSHGVGMEIMRALLKPSRGFNKTPILCLVSEENKEKLSWMITGASREFGDLIQVVSYTDSNNAKEIVKDFLIK